MSFCVKNNVLIAGRRNETSNYQKALSLSGFSYCFPENETSQSLFPYYQLTDLSYHILLLPGGGDISASLYLSPTDNAPGPAEYTSADEALDLLQFQLLQSALLLGKPVLGICKGMQIINVFFGGNLYPHLPTSEMHRFDKGDWFHPVRFFSEFPMHTKIWGQNPSVSQELHELLSPFPIVNSAHHQGIQKLGADLQTLQYSEDFLPETIAHRHLPILGLQWHPERLRGFVPDAFGKMLNLLLKSSQL